MRLFGLDLTSGIDLKARRRIEDLFELTDEIINAYNEINEKYVQQIYRKYKQLKEKYEKLEKNTKCSSACVAKN